MRELITRTDKTFFCIYDSAIWCIFALFEKKDFTKEVRKVSQKFYPFVCREVFKPVIGETVKFATPKHTFQYQTKENFLIEQFHLQNSNILL